MHMSTVTDPFNAADVARAAAIEDSHDEKFVGGLLAVESDQGSADGVEEARVITYSFEANVPGYVGWRWAVTVAQVSDDANPTICDVVLFPGDEAIVAPEWIPYAERLQPGDVGPGDIIPTSATDERLVPGYAALPGDEELDATQLFEFGLGRARVLSIVGRDLASKRWYDGDRGPNSPMARQAPKPCQSCGFFIPISGSLRSAFGVCANVLSPEDARVVSVDHGCGAHSEALVTP
jgi:hypothetical protein